MEKVKNLTKSTLAFTILSLAGKVFGYLRETLMAYYFGAGMEMDAFVAALKITSLFSMMVSNAIAYTFIPMISKVVSDEGEERINYHTNNMLSISVVISAIIVIIAIEISPFLARFVARGFSEEKFNLTIELTRIGMPVIIFSAIVGIMTGYLQYKGKFAATGAVAIPLNLVYIPYLIFLSSSYGIYGLSVASAVAVLVQALFLYPSTKKAGLEYFGVFNPKDKYVIHALELTIPVLLSVAINDINIIINTNLASSLETGTVSWLNYANKLNLLVLGVFSSAITAVTFPILSKAFSSGDVEKGRQSMAASVRLIILITIPSMIGLIILAQPIVEVAFMRGKFNQYDANMTAAALRFYSLALCAMSLNNLLNRVYYSLQDTETPLLMGGISVIFNVLFNIILVRFMGHTGLALGLSLATNIAVFISFLVLKKKLRRIYGFSYARTLIKTLLAGIVMGFATYVSYFVVAKFVPILVSRTILKLLLLLFSVLVSMIVYAIVCKLLGVWEVKMLFKFIRKKAKK